jgi:rare lipoprotein A
MTLLVVAVIAAAPSAAAPDERRSVAALASELAADTSSLAQTRTDLERSDARLERVEQRRLALWQNVRPRLIAVYKHGPGERMLVQAAGSQSVKSVNDTLVALNQLARHDARALRAWQKLDRQRVALRTKVRALKRQAATLERSVKQLRVELSAAERAAQQAREEAMRLARQPQSPLLPSVVDPERGAALSAQQALGAPPEPVQPVGFVQNGEASMYHDSFTGETTANGERYDPGAFTAAHPSLPFGTWVNVSGPGGSVAVRINDRGPFIGGRVIDLSAAAAAAIGLPGIGNVTLSVDA